MTEYQRVRKAINQSMIDTDQIAEILSNNKFTKEELMQFAIAAAEKYKFTDAWDQYCRKLLEEFGDDDIDNEGWYTKLYKEYDPDYVETLKVHPLITLLNHLLDNGFDSNICLDTYPSSIMFALQYVDVPFLAATATRLLLEHGADPYIENEDGECLFYKIDGDIAMDIGLLPDRFVQFMFQCWLVLIGYGARPKGIEPFHLNPGHSYDELKEFEYYDWRIRYEPDAREDILHITDIRTGEEIGYL